MSKKSQRIADDDPWAPGYPHLSQADPRWLPLIQQFGPCPLRPKPKELRFDLLVESIAGQQISTKAADAIVRRLRAFGGEPFTPQALLALDDEHLRSAGLSAVKASYIRNLAKAAEDGSLGLDEIDVLNEAEIATRLTAIKGIGTWTSDMFLIFSLCRADILPLGDLGVRVGLRDFYEMEELPELKRIPELTQSWRPYRTLAMWYLWRLKEANLKAKAKSPRP